MVKLFKDHGAFVAALIFVIGLVASAAVGQYQIRSNGIAIESNAQQQQQDHDSLTRIEVDVRWIRELLEDRDH